jgi:hypothetical protein
MSSATCPRSSREEPDEQLHGLTLDSQGVAATEELNSAVKAEFTVLGNKAAHGTSCTGEV